MRCGLMSVAMTFSWMCAREMLEAPPGTRVSNGPLCSRIVCENTPERFDWLINYINQLGTCFKIMQPITDNFTILLLMLQ